MKLNVPIIRQDKGSDDCGIACLAMLIRYYGFNKDVKEIKRTIKVYEGVGTYAPQLGIYLIKNNFKVEIITMNPFLFVKRMENKSQEFLLKHLEKVYKNAKKIKFKRPVRFFIEFIKLGGKLTVRVPTVKDIQEEIENKRPLIALITSNFLRGDKPKFNFHFNVITGIDEKYIYVNDPLWDERGGKHKYKTNDFIYALYASAYGDSDNASLLKIKRE